VPYCHFPFNLPARTFNMGDSDVSGLGALELRVADVGPNHVPESLVQEYIVNQTFVPCTPDIRLTFASPVTEVMRLQLVFHCSL
jgi:hypothetical protein